MAQSEKIRVAVLFGGRSAEHEVSLQSAKNVIENLDSSQFDVIPIGIDKQGNWLLDADVFQRSLGQKQVVHQLQQQQAWFTPEWLGKEARQQSTEVVPHNQTGLMFDVVFPAVHGSFCEDGTLQGLLELAGVPYVGCGVLSSALGMDKDVSKRLARQAGVNVAPFISFKQDKWLQNKEQQIKTILKEVALPVFVKPANTGSSIGISKVKTLDQLEVAIDEAFRFDTKILVEKALNVHELEIAVLESLEPGADPIVSVVGEIKPSHEFYSYDAKYTDEKGAELDIPAKVSADVLENARAMALKIFQLLDCEGMARVDLFLDKDSGQVYFNEVNTIPGFTQISMYPKLLAASGITYKNLLSHLVKLAINRHKNKSRLVRSYE